ncbi:MAG: Yip1 family protein [Acutalibacteraceae bacterium]
MWWFKCAFMMLFHPIEMVTLIKRKRKEIPLLAMFLPFAISAFWRIISVYTVNYTVSTVSPKSANILLELAMAVVPVALWAVACYGFMTIVGGEATFKETFLLSSYSLMPVLLLQPIAIILSRVLSADEAGFYTALQTLMWAWAIILIFITFKESNSISFGKTVAYTLVILIVMLLIVAVIMLAFALDCQIVLFVQEVGSEMNFFLR